MNGRLYDPILGRMLSPDNYIQLPDFSQNLNRYSYALNNPLIYTDPSGEAWWVIPIYLAYIYLKTAHDNRDPETGKWDWGLKTAFGPDGHGEIGISTNTDFSDMTVYGGFGTGDYIPTVSYNNNMGVGTGYSNNGTNYSYYPYFNYGTPEQNASNSIYQVRSDYMEEWQAANSGGVQPGFDIDKAVNYLNDNAYPKYDKATCGKCAKAVRLSLEAGGINTSNHPISAKDYDPYLQKWGFSNVDRTDYSPLKGDLRIFQNYTGGSIHGHIDMYNGNQWVSDFFENGVFPGYGYEKANNFTIYRW